MKPKPRPSYYEVRLVGEGGLNESESFFDIEDARFYAQVELEICRAAELRAEAYITPHYCDGQNQECSCAWEYYVC